MLRLIFLLCLSGTYVSSNFVQVQLDGMKFPACEGLDCATGSRCVITVKDEKMTAKCMEEAAILEYVRKESGIDQTYVTIHDDNKWEMDVCSDKELNSMGGRILQWFSDVHLNVRGIDRSLKEHTLACRNDVAWMFLQWDGDENGYLTRHEIIPILKGGQEKCVEAFFNRCDDMVIDGQLSIDEWCDCFKFADDLRHEPPCHKAKHQVNPHIPGAFLPRCDLEGYYRPEQCHGGSCWCVDKYGREFDKSRVVKRLPDCGQYGSLTGDEKIELQARIEM